MLGRIAIAIVVVFLVTLVGTFFTVVSLNHVFGMHLVMDLPTYGAILWLSMLVGGSSYAGRNV